MAYTVIRNINENKYYYRVISVREGNKISKRRIYLGSGLSNSTISKKENKADEILLPKKIPSREIEKIKSKIVHILNDNKVKRAGIFGSYSRGEQKKDSDIDLVVKIEDKDMTLLGFIRLNRLLEKTLKKKVDLVEYSAIKPRIKDRILKEEIRII